MFCAGGAAAGPLIGGLITTSVSWRASFALQAVVVAAIVLLSRRIADPVAADRTRAFDTVGAVLSALGMLFIVLGILQAGTNNLLLAAFLALGAGLLAWFFLHIRSAEHAGREALLSRSLFEKRASNLGMATQNIQWLILQGSFFVVSVFLQEVRGLNAVRTGLVLTPATVGILATATTAGRMSRRFSQKTLTWSGFVVTLVGLGLLLALARAASDIWTFVPGVLVMGMGIGMMLTSAVNVVQSAFGDVEQGEISGISRSASNLGSSLGTAVVGSVLVSTAFSGNGHFLAALVVMMGFAVLGLLVSVWLPADAGRVAEPRAAG